MVTSAQLHHLPDRTKVAVGGGVTHRQRPATAGGITFINLEDETGFTNVVVSEGCWVRYRRVAKSSTMVVVRSVLERSRDDVVNVIAERIEPAGGVLAGSRAISVAKSLSPSRDFR